MSLNRRYLKAPFLSSWLAIAWLSAPSTSYATDGAAYPSTSAGLPNFSFSGPEVIKLDWATRSLRHGDWDGDGLVDLAVINNDTARIELLYQLGGSGEEAPKRRQIQRDRWNPVLEDARFKRETVPTGFSMFDMVVGDVTGDGQADLVYTARETALSIRSRNEMGNWTEVHEFRNFEALGWPGTLAIADLDGTGRADLIALAADALRLFTFTSEGVLNEPERYPITGGNPFNLLVGDFTGNGLKDVIYLSTGGRQSIVLRERLAEGGFGPERRFPMKRPLRQFRLINYSEEGVPLFAGIDSQSGTLDFFELTKDNLVKGTLPRSIPQPEVFPTFKKGRQSASYTFGDINGDGRKDLLVANPGSAELIFYKKAAVSFQAPTTFPSFSEIHSLSSGRFYETGPDSVLVLSVSEKILGQSRMDAGGRLSFPHQILSDESEPLVCKAIDLNGDGMSEVVLITEDAGVMHLILARPANRHDFNSPWEVLKRMELEGVRRRPTAIKEIDVFGSEARGLMLFVPREAPVLLKAEKDSPFELKEVGRGSALRESLLKDTQPAQISVFDIDGSGRNALVVGRTGYARALRVVEDRLEMVDQFNARRSEDKISAIIPLFKDDQLEEILFYVAGSGEFQELSRDEDGVFRYRSLEEVGPLELIRWFKLGDERDEMELILGGEDRFWYLPPASSVWTLRAVDSYETELEAIKYSHFAAVDFNQNGLPELVMVDAQANAVEILERSDEDWESRMYWQIFEKNMHYQGRTGSNLEPREAIAADLNGDGKADFAFLVHDRILIYLQD